MDYLEKALGYEIDPFNGSEFCEDENLSTIIVEMKIQKSEIDDLQHVYEELILLKSKTSDTISKGHAEGRPLYIEVCKKINVTDTLIRANINALQGIIDEFIGFQKINKAYNDLKL